MIDAGAAFTIESSPDLSFCARGDGFFGLFGDGTSAAGLYAFDHQGLIPCVLKPEGHFQFLAFPDLSEVFGGIQPLDGGELGRIGKGSGGGGSVLIVVLTAGYKGGH
jgi:hypothetical protein